MESLLPADTFTVINRTILSDYNYRILSMLYQPIIGSSATSMYVTLWTYLDNKELMSNELTHHNLMQNMQISLDKIIEARESLEAIGLIKTYMKKIDDTNNYVYELYSPLSAYDFFKDSIMSTLLRDAVGTNEFKRIKECYKIPVIDLKGYTNITASFNQVFKTVNIMDLGDIENIKKENKMGIAYEPTIDLNTILSLIPSQMLTTKSLTNEMRDLIYKLALVYNYDNDQMKDIIINSIDESHKINETKLKNAAKKLYKFETNNGKMQLIYKNQPDYLKTKLDGMSMKNKAIYYFETESPYDFLASKSGVELSKEETNILYMLLVEIGLTPGVTNVLLDYVLKTSENKLVKSYIESKALEWKRRGIEKVVDAMDAAKEEKKKKTVGTKKVSKEPTWMNKNISIEEATLDEEKAFREKLKNME